MWYIFPIDRRGATDAQLHSDVLSFANQRLFFNDMKSLTLHTFLSQECLTNKALFVGNILFVFNIVHSSPAEKKIQTVLSLLFRWWIFKTLIVIYFIDYGHKALRNMETKMIVILRKRKWHLAFLGHIMREGLDIFILTRHIKSKMDRQRQGITYAASFLWMDGRTGIGSEYIIKYC